jgi:transporter family protein
MDHWLIFVLALALFAGLTIFLGKIGVIENSSKIGVVVRALVVLSLSAAVVMLRKEWTGLGELPRGSFVCLVVSGIALGLSWICYCRGLRQESASKLAFVDKIGMSVVVVLGLIFLGQAFTWTLALGGATVVAGSMILANG